ncbi:sulfate-binding protein, partial [mine drainage metagenome]
TGHPVTPPKYNETLYPPWSHGENDPALHKGLEFTIPEVDSMADFHGSINDPRLVIYVGGNYYFAMAPLVKAFEAEHPELRGKIFYVTIPPGLLIKAMQQGNTFTSGNMTFTAAPDVYAAGLKKVKEQIAAGKLMAPAVPYVTNDLTIMVPKGNPGHITGLADLGKPGVRLVMPNPAWEGVARQIEASLRKAGGPALETMVYDTKVKDGQTILTHIHHRQTPLFLMQGLACGHHLEVGSDLPGAGRASDQPRRHPRAVQHHGGIRRGAGQGRAASCSGQAVDRIPAFANGAEDLRALRLQGGASQRQQGVNACARGGHCCC